MEEALKEVPADALAMGNLDPVSLFKMSSPEEMKKSDSTVIGSHCRISELRSVERLRYTAIYAIS